MAAGTTRSALRLRAMRSAQAALSPVQRSKTRGCPQIQAVFAAMIAPELSRRRIMKLRDSLIAVALGAAVIGIPVVSGTATAADRAYVERCGNCGTVVGVEQIKHKDKHLGAGTAIGAVAGGVL